MNFTEKIFFHEPVNKFFDLPLIKLYAFTALQKVKHLSDPMSLSMKQREFCENKVYTQIQEIYNNSQGDRLKIVSLRFEELLDLAMKVANEK
jgi:hypothetical protein